MLKLSDVEIIDIDLTNICNLKCPLCYRCYQQFSSTVDDTTRTIDEICQQFDQFENIKQVNFAGNYSEPTLYGNLFQLIDYCHKRNIKVYIYTNGSTHNDQNRLYWKYIAEKLLDNDKIIFTICGSTQELHEKYRVGSQLSDIFENALICQRYSKNNNVWIQFIKFEYNKNDIDNARFLFKDFRNFCFVNCDCDADRVLVKEGLSAEKIQYNFFTGVLTKTKNNLRKNIKCSAKCGKQVYIDNSGKVYPCMMFKKCGYNCEIKKNKLIFNDNEKECYICDKSLTYLYSIYNQPHMFLC